MREACAHGLPATESPLLASEIEDLAARARWFELRSGWQILPHAKAATCLAFRRARSVAHDLLSQLCIRRGQMIGDLMNLAKIVVQAAARRPLWWVLLVLLALALVLRHCATRTIYYECDPKTMPNCNPIP
ncbi:MAG TPA: hypothetical protein VFK02_31505 [Kofleriaceae bacterium]|nr:hypothetical protein [Kofleriaceae bacterium]